MTAPQRHIARGALLLIVATSLACTPPAPTTLDPTLQAADAIVREWVDAGRIPGAVLLVARNGEVELGRAYGWAQTYTFGNGEYGASATGEERNEALRRLEQPRPMRTDTIFDLASLTKVMATTFAIMLLVDDGAVDLDAPLRTYLPDFGDATDAPTAATGKADITIRHLLTHRSGLSQWQPVYYSADTADDAYRFIRDFPLAWEVGAERHYSDLGFMLLGLVVERVAGRSTGELLRERLYGPLGLASTGFRPNARGNPAASESGATGAFAATSHGNPFEHRMVHDPDFGYRIGVDADAWSGWRQYTLAGEVNDGNAFHAFGGEAGHAGLFSTAADLQVLLQLLLNRGEYDGVRYISADTIDTFLASTADGQALGWQVPDYLRPGSFNHTGFTGTYVAGVPSQGLAIVLLTNRQNVGVDDAGQYPDIGELQRAVALALAGARY